MRPNVTFIEERTFELPIKDDLEMFKAYLKSDKDNWLK